MIPEDLTTLSDDELTALADQVRSDAEGLAADAATSDEALAQLEALVTDIDRVNAELAARQAATEERAARAAAALDKLTAPVAAEVPGESEAEVMPDAEPAVPAAAAAGEIVEFSAESGDAAPAEIPAEIPAEVPAEAATEVLAEDGDAVQELSAEDEDAAVNDAESLAVEQTDAVEESSAAEESGDTVNTTEFIAEEAAEVAVDEQDIEVASEVTMSENSSISDGGTEALSRLVPDGVAPRTDEVQSGAVLTASNAVPGASEGTVLDRTALATAIAKKRHGMNNASAGSYERIVLATGQSDLPNKVTGGAEENFSVFETVRKQWAESRKQETALVASGGNCAPLQPSYEFFRLAQPLNPVESALPTVEAPRGGIRFITPPDWRDAFDGVRVTTEAEDAAGYIPDGYTEPKPCVHVTCPPVEECRVDAVSQCVTFGNLNYRVFPEQVEAFLADLAVAFTQTKEVFYLDAIDGASTAVTATPAYGATRGTTQTILAAAANYRRRQHMPIDSVLTLMLPSWMVEFIKVDLVNDHMLGLNFLTAGEAEVNAWLASANLDVAWYYDSATGAGQAFSDVQGAGAINPFPTSVVGYLFAPGTFVRLDGGTLDVGIVRDSILNGTNDLQIFSEQWVQVCQVGLESLRLEITLCPDGTGPEPVTPLLCD